MSAPNDFVAWMSGNQAVGKKCGFTYRYHSRSDSHSKALALFVLLDLRQACSKLNKDILAGTVVCGINAKYQWPDSGKSKTIDLAIGYPPEGTIIVSESGIVGGVAMRQVLVSCELKTVMTEHGKSQPRVYDELQSSHQIVHSGDKKAIAAGITVVNAAPRFLSPLRQRKGDPFAWTEHRQPGAAAAMVKHLRGVSIRSSADEVGFDAYATIVISCDNQGPATLWTDPPAPQPGDKDHYVTFVKRISDAYVERF